MKLQLQNNVLGQFFLLNQKRDFLIIYIINLNIQTFSLSTTVVCSCVVLQVVCSSGILSSQTQNNSLEMPTTQ